MKSKKMQFSKSLLIQESILIWIVTLAFIVLAFICVFNGYLGSLPWLSGLITLPWGAYGVSQACYYKKSQAENTVGGITYMTAVKDDESTSSEFNGVDYTI